MEKDRNKSFSKLATEVDTSSVRVLDGGRFFHNKVNICRVFRAFPRRAAPSLSGGAALARAMGTLSLSASDGKYPAKVRGAFCRQTRLSTELQG